MRKFKLIYYLIGSIAFCSTAQADCDKEHWELFKEKCKKSYSIEEDEMRMKLFQENCIRVNQHNEKFETKLVTFKVKLTCRDSEWTQAQLKGEARGYRVGFQKSEKMFKDDGSPTPNSFDWRTEKEISPATNQGHSSSSWAVATSDILQDQCLVQKSTRIARPSSQELLDCCNGGRMDLAFDYIKNNRISSEKDYPYTGEIGQCQRNNSSVIQSSVEISGYINIPHGDVQALKAFIVQHGPVTAAADQSCWTYQHYSQGIYQEPECSSLDLTSALEVVGYGIENGIEYWICKSTFGPSWGENGYIKIATKDNHCGIVSDASSPIITKCHPQ